MGRGRGGAAPADLARLVRTPWPASTTRSPSSATPWPGRSPPPGARVPSDAGRALRQRLLDAIARLRPPAKAGEAAGAWRRYRLLELRYVEALAPAAVQAQLGIEKSQYYREHARAVEAVVACSAPTGRGTGRGPLALSAPPAAHPARRAAARSGPTSFVGRERELAEVAALLGRRTGC